MHIKVYTYTHTNTNKQKHIHTNTHTHTHIEVNEYASCKTFIPGLEVFETLLNSDTLHIIFLYIEINKMKV